MEVTIIGGGFAGLVAATRLAGEGHHVTVIEARAHLGGRSFPSGDGGEPAPRLLFGYFRATRAFLERIGTAGKLHMGPGLALGFIDRRGGKRKERLLHDGPSALGKLGRLGAVAAFSGLSLVERALALRVLTALRAPNRLAPAPGERQTVEEWLDALGQPRGARESLWYPLALATLQDQPRSASARMFAAALSALLLGDAADAAIVASSVDAQQLYVDDARRILDGARARIELGHSARQIHVRAIGDRLVLAGVELDDGRVIAGDAVIAALPASATLALLPEAVRARESYFSQLARLRTAPATTVRLRVDRPLTVSTPALALLGSPFHWLFTRAAGDGTDAWLQSWGDRELVAKDEAALVALAERELHAILPDAAGARVLSSRVVREPDALVAHPAGADNDRPRTRTPVEGLFLAGDYVRTGLPANLESAARSAEEAAGFALEFEPPPPPPTPQGFVPLGRLTKRTPASSN